jgi:glycosyltransferase involved in cell wall biosynthesis
MKRVAMISYSFYESDNRVMRYAEALRERGDSVDVYALARSTSSPRSETLNGVQVRRLQLRVRDERKKAAYLFRILRFLASSFCLISAQHIKKRYDVVHVHNVPDFLVFAALVPRISGARIILDIHDILPEFFASKFGGGESSFYFKLLKFIERVSCRFAHHVIISNHLWLNRITTRSVPPPKCSAIINFVDQSIFSRRTRTRADHRPVILFPGGLHHHQGLDIAIRAFAMVHQKHPTAEFHIYGEGPMKPALMELANELNLTKSVRFFDSVPLREVADVIANADVGVVPKRADSFGNEAFSTKILEFMSQSVPVVASETKIDRYYFDDSIIRFFPSGNHEALAQALDQILTSSEHSATLVQNAERFLQENNWSTRKREYLAIVDNIPVPQEIRSGPAEKKAEAAFVVP